MPIDPFATITIAPFEISVADAQHYLATRRDEMPAEIAAALAAALPPPPPKYGQLWRRTSDGVEYLIIGPQWDHHGWYLVVRNDETVKAAPVSMHADEILGTMERVR